jgi:hypothetical protein
MLSGVLERAPQPKPVVTDDPVEETGDEPPTAKGRGASTRVDGPSRTSRSTGAKRIKGRTVYIEDSLFERIIVQAHRKDRTISEYISALLDRHVPDHRTVRSTSSNDDGAVSE